MKLGKLYGKDDDSRAGTGDGIKRSRSDPQEVFDINDLCKAAATKDMTVNKSNNSV